MTGNLRLALALVAYAVLALLAWRTMDADKLRLVTFAVLGLLAFRTLVHAVRLKREEEGLSALGNQHSANREAVVPQAERRQPSADSQTKRE